ncbi:MAG: anti-sigma factor family protein, partial [bacterium]
MIKCWLCRRFLNAWFDQELQGWKKDFVEKHLAHCPKCQKEWEWLKKLRRSLRNYAERMVQSASLDPLVPLLKEKMRSTPVKMGEEEKIPGAPFDQMIRNLRYITVFAFSVLFGLALGIFLLKPFFYPPTEEARKMGQGGGPVMESAPAERIQPEPVQKLQVPGEVLVRQSVPSLKTKKEKIPPSEEESPGALSGLAPAPSSKIKRLEIYRLGYEYEGAKETMMREESASGVTPRALSLVPQKEHRLFLLRVDLPEPVLVSFKTSLQKYYQIEEVQENDTVIWN